MISDHQSNTGVTWQYNGPASDHERPFIALEHAGNDESLIGTTGLESPGHVAAALRSVVSLLMPGSSLVNRASLSVVVMGRQSTTLYSTGCLSKNTS